MVDCSKFFSSTTHKDLTKKFAKKFFDQKTNKNVILGPKMVKKWRTQRFLVKKLFSWNQFRMFWNVLLKWNFKIKIFPVTKLLPATLTCYGENSEKWLSREFLVETKFLVWSVSDQTHEVGLVLGGWRQRDGIANLVSTPSSFIRKIWTMA